MPRPFAFGHLGIEPAGSPATLGVGEAPQPDTPLRVLLLGDWGGRTHRPGSPPGAKLPDRSPVLVDRDNIDQVLAQFGVELHLPLAGADRTPLTVWFAGLDDFHPDCLFRRVKAFHPLGDLRTRLGNPSTFAAAAEEVRGWISASPSARPPAPTPGRGAPAPSPSPAGSQDLLEQILKGAPTQPPRGRFPGSGDWQTFLRTIVGPSLVPTVDEAKQAQWVALVDALAGGLMRAVLHHPAFQAVEAAWRAVSFLVRRLETGDLLQLYLLDVSKAELASDLTSADDLRSTGVYRLLVEQTVGTPGREPWGVLMGHYTFDPSREDVELLGRLAKVARRAGAPFLAAAGCRLLDCESLAESPDPDPWQQPADRHEQERWAALRALPEAAYLGLALPRFLLRLPYGKDTDPAEPFNFEEMPEGSGRKGYLWGNPAVACVYLLARAFGDHGWGFRPGMLQDIDGLPLHVYREGGEGRVTPCAEALLSERAVAAILSQGLMPLVSVRGRDAVRLAQFQSLADPRTHLAGRWA
jgi:type VI secretion system protein ImpC